MTIIDNDRPTRERVEKMHELIDARRGTERRGAGAAHRYGDAGADLGETGELMGAPMIIPRAGGHVPPATEQEKTRAAELILRAYIAQHPEVLREKEEKT